MMHIIYPFLNRIGTLWVTGSVGPAQEHFISNLIRQKIIVAIDGQVVKQSPDSKKFLLFLPEGELHEMGLLFANYMIRARNHKVIYLGQSLPFSEIEFAYRLHRPDYIFTAITSAPASNDVQPYVDRLSQRFPDATLLLTGYQIVGQDIHPQPNTIIINKIEDLMELVKG